jgi:23S rRNA pseudouridine2605 synthase
MPADRLQKILARRGLASRREAEAWILAGRVRVNGVAVTELGTRADPAVDLIEVDGTPVPLEGERITVLLNKPAGYTATVRDPHAEHTVMELLGDLSARVVPVGRLDRDTTGVLLLTNDGDLHNQLLHPARGVEKVYAVVVRGLLGPAELGQLVRGVDLEDGVTAPAKLDGVRRESGRTVFRLTLREGRKRQVRRMVQAVGGRVESLRRVSFAGLAADGLGEGKWRVLGAGEVAALRRACSGKEPAAAGRPARTGRRHKDEGFR